MTANLEINLKLIIGEEEVAQLDYEKHKHYYEESVEIRNMRAHEETYAKTLLELAKAGNHVGPKQKFLKEISKNYREAKKNLKDAEKCLRISHKRMCKTGYKQRYLRLEIGNLRIKIKSLHQEEQLKLIEKEEKKIQKEVQKEKRKNSDYYSEEILKNVSKMPEEIKRIIREYLPYNVRVALIQHQSKAIITSFKGIKKNVHNHFMFISFLDRIATDTEFLHLLTREEAKEQIPFPTLYDEQIPFLTLFDERKQYQYTYCGYTYNLRILKILKNKILWAMEMAKVGNPKFAYKIMKMIIVLGERNKFNRIFNMPTKNELTMEDLPKEYR